MLIFEKTSSYNLLLRTSPSPSFICICYERRHHLHSFVLLAQEKPPSPEVATFTVFFMAFTAVVGKELMGMSYDSENGEGKAILSTYSQGSTEETKSKTEMSEDSSSKKSAGSLKNRFRDSLNALEIEEAKATGRAQLGLAFEMLTMMKKRALKADPEAYQSLIDACGRVGDTKRASDLLARMHEDGIVADGTVYACLVAAFSADTAWRNGEKDEDLPGMYLNSL